MAQNLQIDPVTRDYLLVAGSSVPSDRVEEAAYYALTIPEGQWLYGQAGQGSELYKFRNQKRGTDVEQLFIARAKHALDSQLVDTGKAQAVGLRNIDSSRTGTTNQIEVIPLQTQLAQQLNFDPV